jgi:hypothetical protein
MLTDRGERRTEVDCSRGLADSTFLVGNPEDPRSVGIWFDGRLAEGDDRGVSGLV